MISVIVPVYNVIEYLDRAVQSIVDQTYTDLEIILVDDGSTDGSGEKCEAWALVDNRIKVVHKPNGGLSSARNAGMAVALGEYFSFPDSDDYIDADYLEKMMVPMDDPNVSLVCACFKITGIDGKMSITGVSHTTRYTKTEALEDIFRYRENIRPSACNKLYRRELFDDIKFNENVVQEDTECMPRIIDSGRDVVAVSGTYYHYIKRPGSITLSSKFNMKSYNFLECFKEYEKLCKDKYEELLPIFYYYEQKGTYGMLLSLVRSSDAYRYIWQEMVLRIRVIRHYIRAKQYSENTLAHGNDMKAMMQRCVIGMRLSKLLFG